jgi:hypothetical protein
MENRAAATMQRTAPRMEVTDFRDISEGFFLDVMTLLFVNR